MKESDQTLAPACLQKKSNKTKTFKEHLKPSIIYIQIPAFQWSYTVRKGMGQKHICISVHIPTSFFCSLQKAERGKGTTAEAAAGGETATGPGESTGNHTEKGKCSDP